jgi:hypothetical protein
MVMENVTSPEEKATGEGDKRRRLEVVEGPNVGALPDLVRGRCDRRNWQQAAFAGLVENVETLAVHRGLRRWEPGISKE